MSITMDHICSQLNAYLERWPDDAPIVADLLAIDDPACLSRRTMTGHFTASAIILDNAGRLLLIEHRALGRLLQPGGHLEAHDDSLVAAARREAGEETGIAPSSLTLLEPAPILVDVHPIPENREKGEGAHRHFDVQYLFRTDETALTPCQEEVRAAEWRPRTDLDRPALIKRLDDLY